MTKSKVGRPLGSKDSSISVRVPDGYVGTILFTVGQLTVNKRATANIEVSSDHPLVETMADSQAQVGESEATLKPEQEAKTTEQVSVEPDSPMAPTGTPTATENQSQPEKETWEEYLARLYPDWLIPLVNNPKFELKMGKVGNIADCPYCHYTFNFGGRLGFHIEGTPYCACVNCAVARDESLKSIVAEHQVQSIQDENCWHEST